MKFITLLLLAISLFSNCSHKEQGITYKPYTFLYAESESTRVVELQRALRSLSKPILSSKIAYDTGWNFTLGDIGEHMEASIPRHVDSTLNIPHRIEKPNQALWYQRVCTVREPGILNIGADDGAQLFIDGKRILRKHNTHFPLDTTGSVTLTIRVLNNAMAGGLNKVDFISYNEFEKYQHQRRTYERLVSVLQKSILFNGDDGSFEKVMDAVRSKTESSISAAEKMFYGYPYLVGPSIVWMDPEEVRISVSTDRKTSIEILWGKDKNNLDSKLIEIDSIAVFTLRSLEAKCNYYYQIKAEKTISPIYEFRREGNSHNFSFNVWADSQSGWSNFKQHIANTTWYNDAFGIGVGDLVENGQMKVSGKLFSAY